MRKSITAVLLAVLFVPAYAHAQINAQDIYCGDCRDPHEHPDDYVNFAYNQVYGEDGWMDFDQADDFFIVNADGIRVYVDIDFVMYGGTIFGLEVPVWPKNMLQITLALPNGTLYRAARSIYMSPLPVPSSTEPQTQDSEPENEGSGEGVDDPEGETEPEPDPVPDIEFGPIGITGIEDPDEDGEFPEPDWCEEC